MKPTTVQSPSSSSHIRLFSAVLIAMSLLLNVGCSSGGSNDNAAANTRSAIAHTVSEPLSAKIKAGINPFEVAGIQDPQTVLDAFKEVKDAIAKGDQAEVANHILYPLRVNDGPGQTLLVQTRRDFVDQYDAIITPSVTKAIANQNPDNLFVNYQGVMVGNGEIWFGGSADTPQVVGIIAINRGVEGKS